MKKLQILGVFFGLGLLSGMARPGWEIPTGVPGGDWLQQYFEQETTRLESECLEDVQSKADWERLRPIRIQQMQDMLGMPSMENRPSLHAEVTGRIEAMDFTVENLHYQSLPGLYVTGNLYLPKKSSGKLPAILYVCGHGRVKKDGVSYGNKTHYRHHGAWFARHGYACLTIDTIQLGEIEGQHHGTYSGKMFWWMSRGYTPAGVEAWNGIRGIDYLLSRPEVDGSRIGVTGRSGGGAYSWWVAALDERVRAAVPVAGITSLRNHVVDGCVEAHCDCMFMVNTQRWDFAQVAALVAPRKLLISNTDNDSIFPLEGVVDVYKQTRRIYKVLGAEGSIGLHITEGPHKDTQPLRMGAFHWFEKHLKGKSESLLLSTPAEFFFEPEDLKVFHEIPQDERSSEIHETFVAEAPKAEVPADSIEWSRHTDGKLKTLRKKTFGGWPVEESIAPDGKLVVQAVTGGMRMQQLEFTAQDPFRLPLFLLHRDGLKLKDLDLLVLNVLDETGWRDFLGWANVGFSSQLHDFSTDGIALNTEDWELQRKMFRNFKWGMAYVAPRGIGSTRFPIQGRKGIQIQRRFYLLGQTLEGMQVWDVRQAVQALREIKGVAKIPLWLQAEGRSAGVALYASLFENNIHRLDLHGLPKSHRDGPHFLNVSRHLDLPEAIAIAAGRSQVRVYQKQKGGWDFPLAVSGKLDWDRKQFKVVVMDDTGE
jgi:dienelactone hydrolase